MRNRLLLRKCIQGYFYDTFFLRQLFHKDSHTYTYLLADIPSKKAVLIDPVLDMQGLYEQLLLECNLNLVYAIDTHVHADHITALGALRDITGCETLMGKGNGAVCVSRSLVDGEVVEVGGLSLVCLATPGHTPESICLSLKISDQESYLFTGDTLLIRGCGRTDFQNGSADALYESLQKLGSLPGETFVYPGHDYRGMTKTTLREEFAHNPRLQFKKSEFVAHMENLQLPDPKMMDVAVPANLKCGNLADS